METERGHGMDESARRAFYRSAAWLRTREAVLARDNYLCQNCLKRHTLSPGTVIHHIFLLEERPDLALEMSNLITLDEQCHNLLHSEKGFGAKGLRRAINVLIGDEAAAYARQMAGEWDVVLDVDAIAAAIGRQSRAIAEGMVQATLRDVRAKQYVFDTLWIVRTVLTDEELATLRAARARFYWLEGGEPDVAGDEWLRRHGARVKRIPPPTLGNEGLAEPGPDVPLR